MQLCSEDAITALFPHDITISKCARHAHNWYALQNRRHPEPPSPPQLNRKSLFGASKYIKNCFIKILQLHVDFVGTTDMLKKLYAFFDILIKNRTKMNSLYRSPCHMGISPGSRLSTILEKCLLRTLRAQKVKLTSKGSCNYVLALSGTSLK